MFLAFLCFAHRFFVIVPVIPVCFSGRLPSLAAPEKPQGGRCLLCTVIFSFYFFFFFQVKRNAARSTPIPVKNAVPGNFQSSPPVGTAMPLLLVHSVVLPSAVRVPVSFVDEYMYPALEAGSSSTSYLTPIGSPDMTAMSPCLSYMVAAPSVKAACLVAVSPSVFVMVMV